MSSRKCAHRDLRDVDDLRVCFECGETLFWNRAINGMQKSATHLEPSAQLDHDYDNLRLQSGHDIRLVVLHPGDYIDPVTCSIILADLLQDPQYEAVSYTWAEGNGDQSKTGRVHSSNGIIKVTENCEAVLRRLRLSTGLRVIWIDAICIDQSCVAERNHQVKLIEQIYRRAEQVVACIEEVEQEYSAFMAWLKHRPELPWKGNWEEQGLGMQARLLFKNRYFTRVWVIQEVLLARRVILQVNGDTIPVDHKFRLKLQTLEQQRQCEYLDLLKPPATAKLSMIQALCLSLRANASDSRDLIYGIASLLKSEIRSSMVIDYGLDQCQVLRRAVLACVKERRNLDFISFAHLRQSDDVNISLSFDLSDLRKYIESTHALHGLTIRKDQEAQLLFTEATAMSKVRIFVNLSDYDSAEENVYLPWDLAPVKVMDMRVPKLQLLPRLTVCARPIEFVLRSRNISEFDAHDKEEIEGPSHCGRSQKDALLMLLEARRLRTEIRSLDDQPEHILRFAFFTPHYVGLSSQPVSNDDEVFSVDGVRHPLLLRAVDKGIYRILGRCYVRPGLHTNHMCKIVCSFSRSSESRQQIEIY